MEKDFIVEQLKPLTVEDIRNEMKELILIGANIKTVKPLSRIGNNIVDFFTLKQRLETKGKMNISFYDFVEQFETFKRKKYIQTMICFYEKHERENKYVLMKKIYDICINAINIMKPLTCVEVFKKYESRKVLNFCSGWGAAPVACAALNLEAYIGIEINKSLEGPYERMIDFMHGYSDTSFNMIFEDCLNVD